MANENLFAGRMERREVIFGLDFQQIQGGQQIGKLNSIDAIFLKLAIYLLRLLEQKWRWGSLWQWCQASEPDPKLLTSWPLPRLPTGPSESMNRLPKSSWMRPKIIVF